MSEILMPVGLGELIDRISILEIKVDKLSDVIEKTDAKMQLEQLMKVYRSSVDVRDSHRRKDISDRLRSVNSSLWDIENKIREAHFLFKSVGGVRYLEVLASLVSLSQAIIDFNRERANLKRELNQLHGHLSEPKQYAR